MADVKRLQIRRDTLADWVSVNPILLEGEVGLIIENGRISSLKIGDGVSSFVQLPQLTLLEAVFGGYVSRQDLSASLRDYATIQYVDSEIGNILGGASGAYDTLKEIEDILKNDTTGLAALLEEIGAKADTSVVDALTSRVSQNESNIADHTNKITANTDNIDSTIRRVAANEDDLKQLTKTVYTINGDYAKLSDIPTKTSQLIDDIGYALAENIKALAGLDIVTKDYIADAAVTTSKIKDEAITRDKLSYAIRQQLDWIPSTTDDLPEGSSNLYFTNAIAVAAVDGASLNSLKVGGYGVSENIKALIQSATAVSGEMSKINASIEGLDEDIERIDGHCDEFNVSIGNLESSVRTNTTDIAGIKTRLDNLDLSYADKVEFDDLFDNVGILADQVSELEEAVGDLNLDGYIKNNGSADLLNITSLYAGSIRNNGDYIVHHGSSNEAWRLSTHGSGNNPIFSKPLYVQEGSDYNLLATQSWANSNFHKLTTVDTVPTLNSSNLVTSGGVAKAVADYLPLSGGILYNANTDTPLEIKGDSVGAYIAFKSSAKYFGYIGVRNDNTPYFYMSGKNHTLIHSGNIGSYAIAKNSEAVLSRLTVESGSDAKIILNNTDAESKYQYISFRQNGTEYGLLGTFGNDDLYWGVGVNLRKILTATNYSNYALPLSGGVMTGDISYATDSHGVYFYKGCGIEKWDGYGPSLVAEGNNTDFWISNGANRATRYKILHEGNISDYALAKDSNGTALLNGNLDIYNADSSIIIKDGAITSSTYGSTNWSIDIDGNGVFNSLKVGSDSVIHSGNIADYVLFKSEIEELTESDNLNEYTSGYFGWQNARVPLNGKGSNTAMLAFKNMRGTESFQLVVDANNNDIWYRGQNTSQVWRDWKTIAFTDSTVAAANKLVTSDSKSIIYDSGKTFYIGDTLYTTRTTDILGKSINLRYGEGAAHGLILNSSGNVGIGTTSPAYKLDVNGTLRATAANFGGDGGINIGMTYADNTSGAYDLIERRASGAHLYLQYNHTGGVLMCQGGGYVGIGTTNPNAKLHVVGSAKITGGLTVGSATDYIAYDGSSLTGYKSSASAWGIDPSGNGSFASLTVGGNAVLTQGALTSINEALNNKANTADVIPWTKVHNFTTVVSPQSITATATDRWYQVVRASANNNMLLVNVPWTGTSADLSGYLPTSGGTITGTLTIKNSASKTILMDGNTMTSTGASNNWYVNNNAEAYFYTTTSRYFYGSLENSSDETLKNILGNVNLTANQIANAPAICFTWKDIARFGDDIHVGTTAQYWKTHLPEVVHGDVGNMSVNYAELAVVSAIILARNIETHEQRIARLEKEISDLQKELNALVNNE